MIASSESPLYQPSIQVSTILMVSSPLSTNCLQLMVERSITAAYAGTDDSVSAAANSIEMVVFMKISFGHDAELHARMPENRASMFSDACRKRNRNGCASIARIERDDLQSGDVKDSQSVHDS